MLSANHGMQPFLIGPPQPSQSGFRQVTGQIEANINQVVGFPLYIAEENCFRFVALNKDFELKDTLNSMNLKTGLKVSVNSERRQMIEEREPEEAKVVAKTIYLAKRVPHPQ